MAITDSNTDHPLAGIQLDQYFPQGTSVDGEPEILRRTSLLLSDPAEDAWLEAQRKSCDI